MYFEIQGILFSYSSVELKILHTWSNEGLVQLLRIVGGDDEHPPLHLHHPVQHLQQGRQRELVLVFEALHRGHLQQAQQIQPAVLIRVLVRHHGILRLPVLGRLAAVLDNVLQVGTVNVLEDVEPLVEWDVLAVHLDVVEDVEQLLAALDLVEGDRDNMALGVVGDCLDGGGLAAARLAVEEEAHGVGDAAGLVPGLVLREEVDPLEDVLPLGIEDVCEGLARLEPGASKILV